MTENPLPADFAADFAPQGAEPPIIRVSDVSFTYDGETLALSGASVRIARGEFVCVLGGNGSGKSTLAKHLNALLLPDKGRVEVCGMDTSARQHTYAIRQSAGMVFQNPDNQIVASVVEEDVAFGPENLGVPPAEIRQRVDQALKMVGMYDLREHSPHLLSGGQKQRVAIAGIIAMMPRCIVLDEATAMLDPVGRRETVETIRTLNEQYGITVLLITHHMDEAAQAQRLIVMAGGHIIDDGPPAQVFQHVDTLRSAGLAVPETVALLYALKQEGFDVPLDAISDEACAQVLADLLKKPPHLGGE